MQLPSSWGCAREGRVGAEVRVVGKVRQIPPNSGVVQIACLHMPNLPEGPPRSIVFICLSGPKNSPSENEIFRVGPNVFIDANPLPAANGLLIPLVICPRSYVFISLNFAPGPPNRCLVKAVFPEVRPR